MIDLKIIEKEPFPINLFIIETKTISYRNVLLKDYNNKAIPISQVSSTINAINNFNPQQPWFFIYIQTDDQAFPNYRQKLKDNRTQISNVVGEAFAQLINYLFLYIIL